MIKKYISRGHLLKLDLFNIKFKYRSCSLYVSFPFLALITTLLLLDSNSTVCWGIWAAFIHECGHVFAMILKKCHPSQIHFRAFSIDIMDTSETKRGYGSDFFILFAGPLANLISAIFLSFFCNLFQISFLQFFVYANMFLAIFNLLPIESLDGGQIVLNLLLRKFEIKTAEKVTFLLSIFTLFPLVFLGVCILLQSQYNFSLLFLSCYLAAVVFFKAKN